MWIDAVRQSSGGRSADVAARKQAVEVATTYARGLAERCRSGKLTRRQAHGLARDIENGMLERKLFEILARVSPDVAKLQDALTQETAAHRDKIATSMTRFGARPS